MQNGELVTYKLINGENLNTSENQEEFRNYQGMSFYFYDKINCYQTSSLNSTMQSTKKINKKLHNLKKKSNSSTTTKTPQ